MGHDLQSGLVQYVIDRSGFQVCRPRSGMDFMPDWSLQAPPAL